VSHETERGPGAGRTETTGPAAADIGGGAAEPQRRNVRYPGGITVRYRWTGTGGGPALIALSEVGGKQADHGALESGDPDHLARAELRVEGPAGAWTVRLSSAIFDEPQGVLWDTAGLLIVKYGFRTYGFAARTGELKWNRASGTPILAIIGSSRLAHVIVQSEIETVALDESGNPTWRVAHSDVVVGAELVGGRLILASYGGALQSLDPRTGRPAET
jgi:hypothetical protein